MGSGQSSASALFNTGKSTCTIVSIEGNIGSGKTTAKEKLKEYIMKGNGMESTVFVDEPTDEWQTIQDDKGVPILVNLYSDIKRFAFRFQMMAYISRLKKLRDALRNPNIKIIITERCLITDAHVFAKMLYDSKHIEEDEYQIYTRWFDEFAKEVEPSCIVYFKASTEVCMNRIKKRSRAGEQDMQYEYLDRCNRYHDDWLITDPTTIIPVLILNANEENCDYSGHIYKYIYDIRASKILGVLHHLKTHVNSSNDVRRMFYDDSSRSSVRNDGNADENRHTSSCVNV
jgi:deoxyadenosine/deoxycytidine kinase